MANEPKRVFIGVRTGKESIGDSGDSDTKSYMSDNSYFEDDNDYFIDEN